VVSAYLDHAATTPLRPEALSAMLPLLTEHFGNPSGGHRMARAARRAVDEARDVVASSLGCRPGEVVFTANGTEADNLAILGVHGAAPGLVVCSAIEHHAVLRTGRAVGASVVGVGADGVVDLDALGAALGPEVVLVSVMSANNEVGTVQPLPEIVNRVRVLAPAARIHTDAIAAVPHVDVAAHTEGVDLVSVSAHKFGGPKGVGALVVREGTPLAPVLHGGGQERDRRPGTHDVAGIVGMAAALRAALDRREEESARLAALRDRLVHGLRGALEGVTDNVAPGPGPAAGAARLPGVANLRFVGVDSEELLLLLDEDGVQASAGAACASGAAEPSHVLLAMGLTARQARSSVRFSLGHTTTAADVEQALAVVPKAVERLRA
jgi:cysteine desulfurase